MRFGRDLIRLKALLSPVCDFWCLDTFLVRACTQVLGGVQGALCVFFVLCLIVYVSSWKAKVASRAQVAAVASVHSL